MATGNSSRSRLTEITIKAFPPKASRYDVRDDEQTGLILRVAPTGRKTWSLSYRNEQGKQQRYTLGTWPTIKLKAARNLATKKLGKVADGSDIQQEKKQERSKAECPTIKVFCGEGGEYANWVNAHHKDGYKTLYRLNEVLPWGNKRLDQIDVPMVERWQVKRIKDGRSPWTVRRDIATLTSMLRKAVGWGYLDAYPLANLKQPKASDNTIVRYLDVDEEKRLLSELMAARTPDYLRAVVLLAMNTGLRKGEVLGLDWSNIDLDAKRLTVTAASAKTSKVRHIPLNQKALTALQEWQEVSGSIGPVFAMGNVRKSWNALLDRARITNFRFHDLRHNFASKLVMAGIDLNTVRELLGHTDIKMTLRYAHLAPEHAAAAVEVL
jgi:integrase